MLMVRVSETNPQLAHGTLPKMTDSIVRVSPWGIVVAYVVKIYTLYTRLDSLATTKTCLWYKRLKVFKWGNNSLLALHRRNMSRLIARLLPITARRLNWQQLRNLTTEAKPVSEEVPAVKKRKLWPKVLLGFTGLSLGGMLPNYALSTSESELILWDFYFFHLCTKSHFVHSGIIFDIYCIFPPIYVLIFW